ncbi:MAG: GNAT family N-acetyltransferase [Bacteroidota bacterium]
MRHQIETVRMYLIPFQISDYQIFHFLNTDPFVRKYLWDDEQITLDTAKEILIINESHFERHDYGLWKVYLKATRELIGYTGLWFFFEEPQPQLIYALLEPHSKKGYATEFAQTIIDYSFNQLGFRYLIAATDEPHISSQALAKRIGMSLFKKLCKEGKTTLFFKIHNKRSYQK